MDPPLTTKASHTNMKEDCLKFLRSCEFNRYTMAQIEDLTFGSIKELWHTKRKVMMTTEEKKYLKTLSVKFLKSVVANKRSVKERQRISSKSVTPSTKKTQEAPLTPVTPLPMPSLIPQSPSTSPVRPPTRRRASSRDMFEDSTVLESLMDTSQRGAGYNTQMGLALSISMVSVWCWNFVLNVWCLLFVVECLL